MVGFLEQEIDLEKIYIQVLRGKESGYIKEIFDLIKEEEFDNYMKLIEKQQ